MAGETTKPVIFISYSRKDEAEKPADGEQWLTYVQSYLAPAATSGIFDIWVDNHIPGGGDWEAEIEEKVAVCDVFILLVSNSSLSSDYVVKTEFTMIEERQKTEDVHIFPVVLTPFSKKAVPWLTKLNLRPPSGKPLSEFSPNERAKAMVAIVDEIVDIVDRIAKQKREALTERIALAMKSQAVARALGASRLSVDTAHLPETEYERLVGRDVELKWLDDAWGDRKNNIISLVAEGGAGKSALVNEWLKRLQTDNYRGAEAVLGWSFYSQGSKERATAADEFLNWTLAKLGIKLDTTSTTVKAEATAEAMMKRRVLLVLDGVEPLQHGPGPQAGQLKDLGLRALLRRFAGAPPAETHGLVVLTSRLAIKDIARWKDSAAPIERVDRLSDEAGAALLRDNGVWGTDRELKSTSDDFGGHPLALGLLASFLKETQFGDVRRRDHIREFFADAENPRHDHAKRVMESYEKEWLANQAVLLTIMQMVGLFDRPASRRCMRALRNHPAIEGLTGRIVDLDDKQWQRAIARLRDVRLLSPSAPSTPDMIDAHPLVREWFGEQLRKKSEAAWRTAHGRLYEHLRDATKEGKTPTLEDLAPLYQAIGHGCRAGRYQEALDDVYIDRICRRDPGGIEGYARFALGAVGSDLAAVTWFFEKPFEAPVPALTTAAQSWVLGDAGYSLAGQGRFAEALPAHRAVIQMGELAKDWNNAARSASNLSQVELTLGNIAAAMDTATIAITHAERTGNGFVLVGTYTYYAEALLAAGQIERAESLLMAAEKIVRKAQPEIPLLSFIPGNRYCELLLAKGERVAARDRATKTVEWASDSRHLMGVALDKLTIGRASLGLALESTGNREEPNLPHNTHSAAARLSEALDGLRAAGQLDDVPRGLLARAVFCRSIGNWDGAARDLDEVEEIAEPGPMRLHLCDMALERVRLAFARNEAFAPLNGLIDDSQAKPERPSEAERKSLHDEAAKLIAIAADYIEKCGYHRRDEELAELQAVLRGERTFASLPPRV